MPIHSLDWYATHSTAASANNGLDVSGNVFEQNFRSTTAGLDDYAWGLLPFVRRGVRPILVPQPSRVLSDIIRWYGINLEIAVGLGEVSEDRIDVSLFYPRAIRLFLT